jgi:NADPH:quinone reductase-like Zn-dependent oxidoreductase
MIQLRGFIRRRDVTLAEYVAIEPRNLALLPATSNSRWARALPISGLTAWPGLFQHGRLQAGQRVIGQGAAGAVGSMVTQLAREFGGYVIGTGRAADRQATLDFGANEFVDLDNEALEDLGPVDLVFDLIGATLPSPPSIRPSGTTIIRVRPQVTPSATSVDLRNPAGVNQM